MYELTALAERKPEEYCALDTRRFLHRCIARIRAAHYSSVSVFSSRFVARYNATSLLRLVARLRRENIELQDMTSFIFSGLLPVCHLFLPLCSLVKMLLQPPDH